VLFISCSSVAMITAEAFKLKYNVEIAPLIYPDLSAIAIARATAFPPANRALAAEYWLGYLVCMSSVERSPAEVQRFEVKPEGYAVAYNNGEGKCDRWLTLLQQLALSLGMQWGARPATPIYADRTEKFNFRF
jgi:hypothetical protein